jgi:hypothetical protein
MVYYRNGIPTPEEGLDEVYDNYLVEIKKMEVNLIHIGKIVELYKGIEQKDRNQRFKICP